jgi:hypothetical protein
MTDTVTTAGGGGGAGGGGMYLHEIAFCNLTIISLWKLGGPGKTGTTQVPLTTNSAKTAEMVSQQHCLDLVVQEDVEERSILGK